MNKSLQEQLIEKMHLQSADYAAASSSRSKAVKSIYSTDDIERLVSRIQRSEDHLDSLLFVKAVFKSTPNKAFFEAYPLIRELSRCAALASRGMDSGKQNISRIARTDFESTFDFLIDNSLIDRRVFNDTLVGDLSPDKGKSTRGHDLRSRFLGTAKSLFLFRSDRIDPPVLEVRDLHLVSKWLPKTETYRDLVHKITNMRTAREIELVMNDRKYSRDPHFGRLLSARIAEKAAITFYSRMGYDVNDISIHQLDNGCREWKNYDLIVDTAYVDVKNVRPSLNVDSRFIPGNVLM